MQISLYRARLPEVYRIRYRTVSFSTDRVDDAAENYTQRCHEHIARWRQKSVSSVKPLGILHTCARSTGVQRRRRVRDLVGNQRDVLRRLNFCRENPDLRVPL
ncbi:hypothetical protein QTP88_008788 [Uroleucon formosanum]